jgi:flagellar basal body-associated protein FliL
MRRTFAAFLLLALAAGSAGAAQEGKPKQKAPEHKSTQSESWLDLDPPFSMTVIGDNRAVGILQVWVGLDIPDAALREDAERSLPVLRDAYLRNLMAFTATTVRLDYQPDVIVIADRLQAVTDRALRRKGARILLRQVALRAR